MIRLGICTSIDHAPILREIGYDYLELNMTQVAQMSEAGLWPTCTPRCSPRPCRWRP